jgi:p-hydroxybenzoate 3-monooxygenase
MSGSVPGLIEFYRRGATALLESYSTRALARVWKAQRFSWWMTSMLHKFPDESSFETRSTAPSSTTSSPPAPP